MRFKALPIEAQTFIPAFNGNRDLPFDSPEQIVFHILPKTEGETTRYSEIDFEFIEFGQDNKPARGRVVNQDERQAALFAAKVAKIENLFVGDDAVDGGAKWVELRKAGKLGLNLHDLFLEVLGEINRISIVTADELKN